MEELAQIIQDALGPTVAVYLGVEWAEKQPALPHVVIVPGGATYGPPDGSKPNLIAQGTLDLRVLCKAVRFDEASDLADLCYAAAPGKSPLARMTYRSEVWGDYTVRVADLTLTLPSTLARTDITRVRVEQFTQHVHLLPLTALLPEEATHGPEPEGHTIFEQSP